MSDSEDEDHAYYGTPLEPLDEDNLPKKKPILVQDQIATDKHGRRRFHGAFTGGFSAGFFNSVGTLEGWKPSAFKSSRSSKADALAQRPEDFMDDEDTDEFGIAPTLLRAKPEYSGSKTKKRKFEVSDGPIPGDPVLKNILEPPDTRMGVRLLMRLGWKPGQGLGPLLSWAERMGAGSDDEISPEELGLKASQQQLLFPPTPVQEHFIRAKADRFGLGYSGLSKEPVLSQRFTLFDDPLKVTEKNNKLSIRGQAFGVGAFEEEDEDIYAKDDMSRYDFALETSATLRETRRKERQREREQLAIRDSSGCLEGFEAAKSKEHRKKFFPPPEIPADFQLSVAARKSRFEADTRDKPPPPDSSRRKHILDSADRAAILGDTLKPPEPPAPGPSAIPLEVRRESSPPSEIQETNFKPFVSDPEKQRRYEKYLGFVKIGAIDALKNIQPSDMNDWEKKREANEFEQAAKLYQPLSGMMGDRFSRGGLLDDSGDPLAPVAKSEAGTVEVWVQAAREKKFGKLTRFTLDWDPAPILCKRMNIPEPRSSGAALAQIAEENSKRKPKFSVFDFLDASKNTEIQISPINAPRAPESSDQDTSEVADFRNKEISLPAPLLDPKIVESEEPEKKMDLFKAIFASSDEEDSDAEDQENKINQKEEKVLEMDKPQNEVSAKNVLRNTSPPRGIFANLDLDALKPKPLPPVEMEVTTETCKNHSENVKVVEEVDPSLIYGPSLPTKPVFISKAKTLRESEDSSTSSDEWIEKDREGSKKKKKRKHFKKHKKEKKKEKHKHKKKKKR